MHEILKHEEFSDLHLDRDQLMRSLGIHLDTRSYLDLSQTSAPELYELLMKSIMWMETMNELLARTKKARLDEELTRDAVANKIISTSQATRVSEAKALAKSDPRFVKAEKRYNMIVTWEDYLTRLINNLEKYHYVIKSKVETDRSIERKY